jgi:hypothetical protein
MRHPWWIVESQNEFKLKKMGLSVVPQSLKMILQALMKALKIKEAEIDHWTR